MQTNIKKLENFHVCLWLAKDTSWCHQWIIAGMIIAAPTLILAIILAWKARKIAEDFAHNVAVCFWLTANVIWMIGEFFYNKDDWFDNHMTWLPGIFFYVGIAALAIFYARSIYMKRRMHNTTLSGAEPPTI